MRQFLWPDIWFDISTVSTECLDTSNANLLRIWIYLYVINNINTYIMYLCYVLNVIYIYIDYCR